MNTNYKMNANEYGVVFLSKRQNHFRCFFDDSLNDSVCFWMIPRLARRRILHGTKSFTDKQRYQRHTNVSQFNVYDVINFIKICRSPRVVNNLATKWSALPSCNKQLSLNVRIILIVNFPTECNAMRTNTAWDTLLPIVILIKYNNRNVAVNCCGATFPYAPHSTAFSWMLFTLNWFILSNMNIWHPHTSAKLLVHRT